ncbi:MAG: acetoacetate--CoA ligase [Gammaproteobacteria bacterium]|nr:acetoacetate--CoA ligase [Gammaproteobacteria bacterium]
MTEPLWMPSETRRSNTHVEQFRCRVNDRFGLDVQSYSDLHDWSVANSADFWSELWDYSQILAANKGETILKDGHKMPGAVWFPEAQLNFAENLLRCNTSDTALMFKGETGGIISVSYRELNDQVAATAAALRECGIGVGDRVAGFLPNIPEAIVAMLATSSIGAIWSSCSPDFGVNGVLDRFGQIEPKVLFCANGYRYNGKQHDSLGVVSELAEKMPSLEQIIVVNFVDSGDCLQGKAVSLASDMKAFYQPFIGSPASYEQLPFDHPLYILFSSGTTGKPKCIVHGAGGTLLQHVKEHLMHADVKRGDKVFFFTTCGWMMWNWLVSGLAVEATLLLYDGSPFYPDGNVLFDYAEQVEAEVFGVSAKFIDACNKANLEPIKTHRLTSLKTILSTGSPLVPESFDFVYEKVAKDVCLSSMSGGTDIVSCFVLGNPALPVHRGELQALGLGLNVQAFDDEGKALPINTKGELVCSNAFPCMPLGFYNDDDGSRYHAAYFDRFDNVWCHGDYVSITEHGGMVIFGRSDAVLNPGGVRIGTAEIYRQVEQFEDIVEALVIGQSWNNDTRVVLFVRLREGAELTEDLIHQVKSHIREQTTPRHVPAKIVAVPDIPRTRSGKIVELAVRKVVHGESVDNIEALANPEALAYFENVAVLNE